MAVAAKARRSGGRAHADDAVVKILEPRPIPPDSNQSVGHRAVPETTEPAVLSAVAATSSVDEFHDALATKIGTRIDPASMIFDGDWYKQKYPDVAAAQLDPVRHYFDDGFREGRNPNRYFDTVWYASSNPDVAAARLNPFMHYLLYGAVEGRLPAP